MLRRARAASSVSVVSLGKPRDSGSVAGHEWPMNTTNLKISALLAALVWCGTAQAIFGQVDFTAGDDFSEPAIRRGVKATEEQCRQAGNAAVWAATSPNDGECIKYWSAGLTTNTGRVVLFMHGDIVQPPPSVYLNQTGALLQEQAVQWSRRINAPYIFLGRPGTHGSSGDHSRRRTPDEGQIISKALDALRSRHGITEFVVAGQSGGAHATSSLLTLRDDIVCAIPASGPNSPRIRYQKMGRTMDITNRVSYEPADHFQHKTFHPRLRVFVLGDPQDSSVIWESQLAIVEPLKARGIELAVIEGIATGAARHALNNSARYLAGLCYHDKSTAEIGTYLKSRNIRG